MKNLLADIEKGDENVEKLKRLLRNRKLILWGLTTTLFLIFAIGYGNFRNLFEMVPRPALVMAFETSPLLMVVFFLLSFGVSFIVCKMFCKKSTSDWREFEVSESGVYGKSDFLSDEEKRKLFNMVKIRHGANVDPKGIILAKDHATGEIIARPWKAKDYLHSFTNENIALVGSSGLGKTSSILLPMLFELMRMGYSIICTDPKSELYRETYAVAVAAGYKIKVINLLDGQFEYSDGIDLVKLIRTSSDPQTAADVMAKQLIVNFQGESTGKDTFWVLANLNCLKLALLYVALSDNFTTTTRPNASGSYRTIEAVYALLTSDNMLETLREAIEKSPVDKEYLSAPFNIWSKHREAETIRAGLGTALGLLQNKAVSRILSEDDICFDDFNDTPTILYIVCSDRNTTFRGVLTTITTILFDEITKIADSHASLSLDNPLYFMFEELFSIGKIPDIVEKVTTLRSRKIGLIFCLQDIVQLRVRYEDLYETILGNCAIKLFLGGDGDYTTRFFSDLSGNMTAINEEAQKAHYENDIIGLRTDFGASVSARQSQRTVLLQDDIAKLQMNELLIFANGRDVLKEHKYYYKDHYYYGFRLVDADGKIVTHLPTMRVPKWKEKMERDNYRQATGKEMPPQEEKYHIEYFPELLRNEEENAESGSSNRLFSKIFEAAEQEAPKDSIRRTENTFEKFTKASQREEKWEKKDCHDPAQEDTEYGDSPFPSEENEFFILDEDRLAEPPSNRMNPDQILLEIDLTEEDVFGDDFDD